MMSCLWEIRRRLTWLWRLARCGISTEVELGEERILWVFDTRRGPDGYPLRPHLAEIAKGAAASIWSFGPRRPTLPAVLQFLAWAPLAFQGRFDDRFAELFGSAFSQAAHQVGASRILSGSYNGHFGALIRRLLPRDQLWELQHGFLDGSYFPLHAQTFFARSRLGAAIVGEKEPGVSITLAGTDLDPPVGVIQRLPEQGIAELHCFSKNPGGGCTTQEVVQLEAFAATLARSLGCEFHLHLHPRDNIIKLVARHRGAGMISAVGRANRAGGDNDRIVVSSFSTALATRSRQGDLLANLQLSTDAQDDVRAAQYSWLPTCVAGASLDAMHLFRRLA